MNIDYSLIPEHMREGTKLYIERGVMPGSFLQSLLSNDPWGDVLMRADHINARHLGEWRMFISTIPMVCWGSEEKVISWIRRGGLACTGEESKTI